MEESLFGERCCQDLGDDARRFRRSHVNFICAMFTLVFNTTYTSPIQLRMGVDLAGPRKKYVSMTGETYYRLLKVSLLEPHFTP